MHYTNTEPANIVSAKEPWRGSKEYKTLQKKSAAFWFVFFADFRLI
jgi:hypothetical protein